VRMSWGPPMYAAILGAFDALAPGTGLFTFASLTTTALAWAALPLLRGQLAWSGPVLLASRSPATTAISTRSTWRPSPASSTSPSTRGGGGGRAGPPRSAPSRAPRGPPRRPS
jgi:hypothetical protein